MFAHVHSLSPGSKEQSQRKITREHSRVKVLVAPSIFFHLNLSIKTFAYIFQGSKYLGLYFNHGKTDLRLGTTKKNKDTNLKAKIQVYKWDFLLLREDPR